jgi:hypothetical protein
VACTFYALVTKEDFTIKWGLLAVLIMAMLMLAVFSLFRWSDFLYCLYCTVGGYCVRDISDYRYAADYRWEEDSADDR